MFFLRLPVVKQMADLVPSIMRGDPSKSPRGPRPPMVEALIALEEAFRCPICQDLYREPKMYPCTHSACRDCANQAIAFKQECPVCKYNVSLGVSMSYFSCHFIELRIFIVSTLCNTNLRIFSGTKCTKLSRQSYFCCVM